MARDADREALWARVCVAHVLCGTCTLGEVLAGDGIASAKFRFVGEKASAEVELTLNASNGKLHAAVFRTVS